MGGLMLALLSLLAWGAASDRDGPLWRGLVAAPAAWLAALRPRDVLVVLLFLLIAPLLAEMAVPSLVMVMAVDLAAWIEVTAAVIVVARLLPGWKALRLAVAKAMSRSSAWSRGLIRRAASRARRSVAARRPGGRATPDEDRGGLIFA
jgi:small-conductance mechanosensitive channel